MAANKGSYTTPLFELFASLGLDTSPLIEGLGDAKIEMGKMQTLFNDFAINSGRAFKQGANELIAFKAAVLQATTALNSEDDAADFLSQTINKLIADHERLIEAKRLEAESYASSIEMSRQQAEAQKAESASKAEYARMVQYYSRLEQDSYEEERALKAESDEAELAAMNRIQAAKDEAMAKDAEYAKLKAKLAQEAAAAEEAAYNAALDEEEILNEEATRRDLERLAEREAATRQLTRAWQEYAASAGGGGGGGFTGGGSGGLTLGAGGINPYFRLRESIAGLNTIIAPLMDVLIPVTLIGLGIELMERYGKAIRGVVYDMMGIVDTSKMLEDSLRRQTAGIERLGAHQVEIDRIAKREGKSTLAVEREIGAVSTPATRIMDSYVTGLIAQQTGLAAAVKAGQTSLPGFHDINTRMIAGTHNVTGAQDLTLDSAQKRLQEITDSITTLKEKEFQQKKEEIDIMDKHTKSLSKMHDRVHEYSERLPSATSINPAAYMLQTMGFGPQPTQVVRGNTPLTNPPASYLERFAGSSPVGAPSSVTRGGTSSPTVSGVTVKIDVHYLFNGIPADVQDFMRNKAEPKLIEDLSLNTGALTDKLIKALKDRGVRVG